VHDAVLCIVPPRWKIEPHDWSVVLGDNVVVDCQSDGDPAPVVTWNKDDGTSTAVELVKNTELCNVEVCPESNRRRVI